MSDSFQNAKSMLRKAWPLFIIGGLWLGAGTVDWLMRFHFYQWHRSFLVSTFKPRFIGDWPRNSSVEFKPGRGGDLSSLLGVPEAIDRYGVDRTDEGTVRTDEFGFPNDPPTTNRYYPVVLVGDSFLLQGRSSSNLMSARLERILGTSVYTVAHAGRGSAFSMTGFFDHPHFREQPPRVLVWFLPERDATGFFFDSVTAQAIGRMVYTNYIAYAKTAPKAEIDWLQLSPARLKSGLPNTSVLAQSARHFATWLRYRAFKMMNDSIVISRDTIDGHHMLFYRENIKALSWSPEVRDIPKVGRAAFFTNRDYFQKRGIRWVVVLIPEKEQVYRDFLPPLHWLGDQALPPSSLPDIEAVLQGEGIAVVDLLPVFRDAVARGELIYWPDDTHWNFRGMELAAERIGQELESEPELR